MMSGDVRDGAYFLPFGAERLSGQAGQCTAPGGAASETAMAATVQWRGAKVVQLRTNTTTLNMPPQPGGRF